MTESNNEKSENSTAEEEIVEGELEEGELYVLKKGVLEHLQKDPDDNLRKIRITDDGFKALVEVQRGMRKAFKGYKPDITIVCSALLENAARDPENATAIVKEYAQKMFS
jgi:hypothetical protein